MAEVPDAATDGLTGYESLRNSAANTVVLFEAAPARDPAACRGKAAARMDARDKAWRKARAGELARAIGSRN
jgi:hypothetical protein